MNEALQLDPANAASAPRAGHVRQLLAHAGPAFVAAIAYIDPGNFAANFDGGARFGYKLLWVLLWSNAMAMLIQYLSAKLGIATGRTLPQNCRTHFSRSTTYLLWVAAEIAALATDLAEFLGAALGVYLLFGVSLAAHGMSRTGILFAAALVVTVLVFALLALESRGFRRFEIVIVGFVCIIGVCYALELGFIHPAWKSALYYTLVPSVDRRSIYIAVSMLGATVMPHVVYLHSALVQPRLRQQLAGASPHQVEARRARMLFYERLDVLIAMNGAWLVNSAMVIVAAAAFARRSWPHGLSIEDAHQTLGPLLGQASATIFAVALLCSGLSSATVGTMAGQVILEGFLEVRFSIFLRRLLTLVPALVVIGAGLDPLRILLLSQVVLSFALPFALVPLLLLTGRRAVMGAFANRPLIARLGWVTAGVIMALNAMLLWQVFTAA
ncbi:MAG TPA: Nramp family divalent metal transporter [Acidobacteriaceae bacterium]